MEPIKIFMIIGIPVFGLLTFFLLKYYNSGYGTLAAKSWAFKTAIITLVFFLTSIILYLTTSVKHNKLPDNQIINKIEEVEKSINDLNEYIIDQKRNLEETSSRLEQLKSEHNKLQPIVQTEREIVDTLFEVNDSRHRREWLLNIIIGFITGITSTLICTSILNYLST